MVFWGSNWDRVWNTNSPFSLTVWDLGWGLTTWKALPWFWKLSIILAKLGFLLMSSISSVVLAWKSDYSTGIFLMGISSSSSSSCSSSMFAWFSAPSCTWKKLEHLLKGMLNIFFKSFNDLDSLLSGQRNFGLGLWMSAIRAALYLKCDGLPCCY